VSNVVQLYRRLLRARSELPQPEAPPTIGDVYQRLIPYRSVRSEVGFSELKEYEHALMRLLAGEHGYVTLASEEAAGELRRELESPNPILGVYRDYAAVEVSIREDVTDPMPPAPPSLPAWMSAGAVEQTLVPEARGVPASPPAAPTSPPKEEGHAGTEPVPAVRDPGAARSEAGGATAPSSPAGAAVRSACWACRCALLPGRSSRYCPACGAAQVGAPCHACGETLEPRWRFCVDCGTERRVGAGGDSAGRGG
jgi:hypothetical protein